jgi:type II secretory pathway pseudopilin PulG
VNRIVGGNGKRFRGHHEKGYALLTLLLIIAVMIIGAAIVAPSIAFQIRRDREEELIHRGVQYTRAIRNYASKTGRFPMKVEDLQQANGVRFIRKLYKDPITGGEFKLLRMSDMAGIGLSSPSTSSLNPQLLRASTPMGGQPATPPASQTTTSDDANSSDPSTPTQPNPGTPQNQATPVAGPASAGTTGNGVPKDWGTGGAIFGVASKSKNATIREFNHKNHYNDWLFFYYPPYGGRELSGPTSLAAPLNGLQAPGAQRPPSENPSSQPQQ